MRRFAHASCCRRFRRYYSQYRLLRYKRVDIGLRRVLLLMFAIRHAAAFAILRLIFAARCASDYGDMLSMRYVARRLRFACAADFTPIPPATPPTGLRRCRLFRYAIIA